MLLPRGIALIRVETPLGHIVVASDRMSDDEERTARIIAADRVLIGAHAVVLGVLEVMAVLRDLA